MAKNNELTNKDLLIRIDERQKYILKVISAFQVALSLKVDKDDFDPYAKKIDKIWDERNRIIGYIVGGGLAGGAISQVLGSALKAVLAYF